jgi:NTE family protein
MNKLGLALGGGGARGLAHIAVLETFDRLGIRPSCISGTSIGAIFGALYAAGMTGAEIRTWSDGWIIRREEWLQDLFQKRQAWKSLEFIDLTLSPRGLLKGASFMEELQKTLGIHTFEALQTPLRIVASDFWTGEQVVFEHGELLPAIRASMSLPGIFTPVSHEGRLLVDGGGVNPVPHDLLLDCDGVVAVDVLGFSHQEKGKPPHLFRTILGMFDIMQQTIIEQRLAANPPNLYLRPDIRGIELLAFHESEAVYEQSAPAILELDAWLRQWLNDTKALV